MDPIDPLGSLTPQQIMYLANLARARLIQQGEGPSQGQVAPDAVHNYMQPQPQGQAQSGGFGTNYGEAYFQPSGGAQASNEATQFHTPPHQKPVDVEETTSPLKNKATRRAPTTTKRKGKKLATDQEATRIKQDNFAPLEDRLLVKSWLEISCDPMTNTGQDQLTFWSRITNLYNSKRGSYPERSLRSLQSRYDLIKKPVAKFASCYADVVRRNPSGMTDADKTSLACSEFASVEPKRFKFMHVWDIMKDNPKFQDTKHGRTFRAEQPEAWEDQLLNPLGNEATGEQPCVTPSTGTSTKRPMGRDAAKRAAKRTCPATPTGSDFAQSMQELVLKYEDNQVSSKTRTEAYMAWKKEQEEEARQDRKIMIELEREKLAVEKQRLKLKEKQSEAEHKRVMMLYTEQEERILGLDLSKYSEPLRSYYKKKQLEIQERNAVPDSQA